jgi:hypothetical protein
MTGPAHFPTALPATPPRKNILPTIFAASCADGLRHAAR